MECMAFKRANLTAVPVGAEDGARSQLVSNFMRWLIQTQIPEVEREVEMCSNYMNEKGVAIMGQFWEKRREKVLVNVRVQDLQQQFPNIDIVALIEDKSAADDLKAIFQEQYGASKDKAARMLRELRDKGERFLRLTTVNGVKSKSTFKVNGTEVSRDEFEKFLVPSARSSAKAPTEVFNIKEANLVSFNGEVSEAEVANG